MISFECDYNNGAHPEVLKRLIETNDEQTLCYDKDSYTKSAKDKIKSACEDNDADVFFLTSGTQTNATVISSLLKSYEGVIAVDSGHINVHESGAIEYTGHKVITLKGKNGKMEADSLRSYMEDFTANYNDGHSVYPGMVYISLPTELGTIYNKEELDLLYKVCCEYNLALYIDGARLGYGMMSEGCDITLPFLAGHCDVFYIGGTKQGALCGEAVVFTHNNAPRNFIAIQKQHGALLAKGRLTGIQFDTLFTDSLYFRLSRHAIDMAMKMKKMFAERGYKFFIDSPTNQQFIIMSNDEVERISKKIVFTHWGPADENNTICRFVTSWATTEESLKELEKIWE